MIKKQSGFSLIEVLVALMLMGVLGAAGVEMLQQHNKTQVDLEAGFDTVDLASEIRAVLSNPASCKATFGGKSLSNGTSIDPVKRSVKNPTTGVYTDSTYISLNDPRGQRIKLKSLTLVAVDAAKGQGSLEVTAEGIARGAKNYRKTIPLTILPNKNNASLIDSCVAVGGPPVDPVELCTMTGGAYNRSTSKCQTQVDLDTGLLPTYCPPGSQISFEEVGGKPRMKCTPCTPILKFSHYECDDPIKGMNFINKCYYKTVCQNNTSIELYPAEWDFKIGPTSASGGDTGKRKNCRKKRRACDGE